MKEKDKENKSDMLTEMASATVGSVTSAVIGGAVAGPVGAFIGAPIGVVIEKVSKEVMSRFLSTREDERITNCLNVAKTIIRPGERQRRMALVIRAIIMKKILNFYILKS